VDFQLVRTDCPEGCGAKSVLLKLAIHMSSHWLTQIDLFLKSETKLRDAYSLIYFFNGIMKEITFFGRGGQGAVVASEMLADAYFHEGYQVQSFPSFGVERRGAPVMAFLRVDKEFIYLRSMIYKIDFGVVLAPDIVNAPIFKPTLKTETVILINSREKIPQLDGIKASYVDATGIALEYGLGSKAQPLVNTAMLGAFAKISGDLKLDNLLQAVKDNVPQKTDMNIKAVIKAYESAASYE